MTHMDAANLSFRALNERIASSGETELLLQNVMGQRYIGAGTSGLHLVLDGVPGNALGAYLNGTRLEVNANAQDAVGDTMNEGEIIIHGSCGDALGYAMRGGRILVRGDVGYRAGIHMKAYKEKQPVIVVGGEAGCFLGEYQAGGLIVVLGLNTCDRAPVGEFCATGMHGGAIFLRSEVLPLDLPQQVSAHFADREELALLAPQIQAFCAAFGLEEEKVLQHPYLCIKPNTKNPYKQLYTQN